MAPTICPSYYEELKWLLPCQDLISCYLAMPMNPADSDFEPHRVCCRDSVQERVENSILMRLL